MNYARSYVCSLRFNLLLTSSSFFKDDLDKAEEEKEDLNKQIMELEDSVQTKNNELSTFKVHFLSCVFYFLLNFGAVFLLVLV